jgi:hypothetical protein
MGEYQDMKTLSKILLAATAVSALGAVGAAVAQPAGPRATLYEYPNFQGRSVTVYRYSPNLDDSDFNDTAQSGHFDGDWTICTDSNLRGQCTRVAGDITNLNQQGMGRTISSLQANVDRYSDSNRYGDAGRYGDNDRRYDSDRDTDRDDDRGYQGGGYGSGYSNGNAGGGGYAGGAYTGGNYQASLGQWGGEMLRGRTAVFFARPQSNGQDIAALDRTSADWFCRRQGLGSAAYFDTSTRGRGWRWQNGAFSLDVPVLRDVLCRRF